jgi:hypothetical protein
MAVFCGAVTAMPEFLMLLLAPNCCAATSPQVCASYLSDADQGIGGTRLHAAMSEYRWSNPSCSDFLCSWTKAISVVQTFYGQPQTKLARFVT